MKEDLDGQRFVLGGIGDKRARDREAVAINTQAQVRRIFDDPKIAKKVQEGELIVIGAFYEITSGLVDFFDIPSPGSPVPPSTMPNT